MDEPDDRDRTIAELREQLDQERSYSQMVETYVETKLREVIAEFVSDKIALSVQDEVDNRLGDFDWISLQERFDKFKSLGSSNHHIDRTLDQIIGEISLMRYTALPKLGIDPVSMELESEFDN